MIRPIDLIKAGWAPLLGALLAEIISIYNYNDPLTYWKYSSICLLNLNIFNIMAICYLFITYKLRCKL